MGWDELEYGNAVYAVPSCRKVSGLDFAAEKDGVEHFTQ